MTRRISRLSEIADTFDAVLVDQFGVLHDGRVAFPGALLCLEALLDQKTPVVALTNSGKRTSLNRDRLARLSFRKELFADVISSGELARASMKRMLANGRLKPGARITILSRDTDLSVIEGLNLIHTEPGADSDLLVIAGAEPERFDRKDYRKMLAEFIPRDVPAICANPDRVMYIDGKTAFGAGCIAEDYAAMGGSVRTVGKPGQDMFLAGMKALGDPKPSRTLMIGDSPEHDIAGGAQAGCLTLLVLGGVQAETRAGGIKAGFSIDRLVW